MVLYMLSAFNRLSNLTSSTKHCWFADDASGAGSTTQLNRWWDTLTEIGPNYLVTIQTTRNVCSSLIQKKKISRETFKETAINITTQGHKHLGVVVRSRSYLTEYVRKKAEDLKKEITKLSEFATTQPRASYAVYTFGLNYGFEHAQISKIYYNHLKMQQLRSFYRP